jgi:lysophospholipase L1-like esterase
VVAAERAREGGRVIRRRRLGALALLLASLALTSGVAEVALRAAGYTALHQVYSRPELFWRHDPVLGWSLEPGAKGRFTGPRPYPIEFDTTIEINSLGLRGPEIGPRAPGELRILFLGDSFVAGFEVEQAETFTALFETRLARRLGAPVRVINGAVRGYGTDQSYLWFRERGRALGADVVVAVFSANDFEDNLTLHRARRPFGKPAFGLRPNGALELVGTPVPRYEPCSSWVLDGAYRPTRVDGAFARGACSLQTRLADRSALFTLVATSLGRLPGLVGLLNRLSHPAGETAAAQASLVPWPLASLHAELGSFASAPAGASRAEREGRLTTALLQALAREVRASGAGFLLLMIPQHWPRVDLRALRADRIDPKYVTLSDAIDPSQIRFRNDSHLNALGHRLYAEGLTPVVEAALRGRPR